MTAPTHIAFCTVTYLYLCTIFRIPLALGDALLAAIASLLPDLDISSSGIGRRFRFIASRLEKRFGHRTITHSFLGTFTISLLSLPLLFLGYPAYVMSIIGYFSHSFLDMFSKEGVQFFWPSPKWGVFPAQEEHRITVSSTAENILLAGFMIVSLLLYPIASIGMDRALHWVMADISGAVKDYHTFSPGHRVHARMKGTYRKIDRPVTGTFPVIDALSEYSMLVEVDDKPHIIGTPAESHIVPTFFRIIKGEPIVHYTQVLVMDGHTLGELSPLAQVEHRLFGTLKTLAHFDIRLDVIHYNPISQIGPILTLDHATYDDIRKLGLEGVPILASNLLVETILPQGETYKPFSFAQTGTAVFPISVPIATKEDVKVQPEQQIAHGKILVAHSGKLREITLTESEIETLRKLRDQQSFDFTVQFQKLDREIESTKAGINSIEIQLKAYQRSLGFEKEIGKLQSSLENLREKKQTLLGRRKELSSKDTVHRLVYQQKIAELLVKKGTLKTSAYTRAEFDTYIVNIEFHQGKCTLYLRRLTGDSKKGTQQ